MLASLGGALLEMLHPVPFFWVALGVVSGIFVGAIPGLSGGMLIVLVMPLTFYMDHTLALILMVGIYVGSVAGGLISATLLRMPGTPSSVVTTFDGYPMARGGQPARALALGISASLFGGFVAGFFLVVLSPPLSRWATSFGPWEYFGLVLMALVLIAAISQGSMVKGLISGALGLLAAMPGLNASDGQLRLTFGFHQMDAGFALLPVLLGVFVVSQIIRDAMDGDKVPEAVDVSRNIVLLEAAAWVRHAWNMLRSALIGTWIGILPGVGASISSMVAYGVARTVSRRPDAFGKGSEEGVVASESANNANVGGALIPLVTMGIPGSPIDAFLLGALLLHNIQPGPLLFQTNGDLVWAIIAAYLVGNVLMFLVMSTTVRFTARLANINPAVLLPAIFVFCIIGAYALSNRLFDVWVMIGFGILGFLLQRAAFPLGAFVIGFVLSPIFEAELRSAVMSSGGTIWELFTRPIALTFIAVAVLVLFLPLLRGLRRRPGDGPDEAGQTRQSKP
ncbi:MULTISPECIES: tripartite tricarboxylate transporter permease [Chelativorans]|uniref:Tripartite tricarboxylate transporter permease n=1 Tax=Chelativorans intermedius TaxID=515947 RepID=A0ABV6DD85_9HYPH|nr:MULTISPECIES: tripartite tricarboxylate transporter permease [Chelativorans]MCT9000569.1 tripartite tricarboxylate transporter permease [Chelativorans intermedius]WEX12187.1 tripartite tricarboxylate transporter permease [Chelativorans sp. AA-79]